MIPEPQPSAAGEPGAGEHAARCVLAVETSCDETAAAVVRDGLEVVGSVVASQVDLHARFGGVVPEIAGRAHVELILPVVVEALERAGMAAQVGRGGALRRPPEIGAVAATVGPGLIGSLLVGVSAAKALALAWRLPFVGVNHLEGHLYAALLEDPAIELPSVVLLVSGGHTLLVRMDAPGRYAILGQTIDDAAGEAFDKVARYLGLGYPGGPAVDRVATQGDASSIRFPRARLDPAHGPHAFSFSGLKTAVVNHVRADPEARTEDVAASFQEAVVSVLVDQTMAAASAAGARSVCLAGGVAANSLLRERTRQACGERGLRAFLPSRAMCTDNAAMIAAAGWWRWRTAGPTDLAAGAEPNLRFPA